MEGEGIGLFIVGLLVFWLFGGSIIAKLFMDAPDMPEYEERIIRPKKDDEDD